MIGTLLIVGGAAILIWGVVDGQGSALTFGAFLMFGGVITWVRREQFLAH